jgi:hypothetical protein
MKKIILYLLTVLCTLYTVHLHAQAGMLWNKYYITGSMALGTGDRQYADTSAWLQLGKDTTKRGFLMPRVLLDSITTGKKGLFVYSLQDSVLYHFDGTKRVKYMTWKDTASIASKSYADGRYLKKADTASMLSPYLRKGGLSASGSGLNYNSSTGVLTSAPTLDHVLANGNTSTLGLNTGKLVSTAAVTASGGTARGMMLTSSLTANANNNIMSGLYISNTYNSGSFTNVQNNGLFVAQDNPTNSFTTNSVLAKGSGAQLVRAWSTTNSGSVFVTGDNSTTGKYNGFIGENQTASISYWIGQYSSNEDRIQFMLTPSRTEIVRMYSNAVLIGQTTNNNNGVLQITGTSIFNGNLGIKTNTTTSSIDINGSNGYNQLRLRISYTPTGTSDTNGSIGDFAWDDSYVYIKTNVGWKRLALASF